jgi:hypothetical protein
VPKDLELRGDEEIFTATVTFDMKNLFGNVDAICRIKLKNPQGKRDENRARQ